MAFLGGVFTGDSDGFAAVDGLVALTMLATTMILVLGAASSAQRAAATVHEIGQANRLISFLMNTPKARTGDWAGIDRGLKWRLEITPVTDPALRPDWRLCRRSADVVSIRTQRRYGVSSAEVCPKEPS